MSETKEERMKQIYDDRRKDFLRDMSIQELGGLLPSESQKLFYAEDWDKEELIDVIMENYFDKQINPEVK